MDPVIVENYATFALHTATRCVLHKGEAFPKATAVAVAVNGDDILGARVYFEAPNKIVWVAPPHAEGEGMKVSMGDYEGTREKQTPADCEFHCFQLTTTQFIADAVCEVY